MNHDLFLTKESIQDYVGLSSFQKGEEYAASGSVRQGRTKGALIQALCQGAEWSPYATSAIIEKGKIKKAYCSCPVGAAGRCKHMAALLLTWIDNPSLFTDWEALKEYLGTCEKDVLVELIDLLEDQIGDFSDLIQSFKQKVESVSTPRLAKYLRRIEEAFKASKFPWYHPDEGETAEIAFALAKIRSSAQELVQEGLYEDSVAIYRLLIKYTLNYLEDHQDVWGNLHAEIRACIQSFPLLLQSVNKVEIRQKIFKVLFSIIEEQSYRTDDIGANEAKEVIIRYAEAEEKAKIASWVETLQKTAEQEAEDDDAHSDVEFYKDQPEKPFLWIEDFLIDLKKDVSSPDVYLEYYRQTNQTIKLVSSLLELERIEEAWSIAEDPQYRHRALALAPLFVSYQQNELAESLLLKAIQDNPHVSLFQWLKEFYKKNQKMDKALEQAMKILQTVPNFSNYQEVRDILQASGQWDSKKDELLTMIKKWNNSLLMIEIYLDEREFDPAIQLFQSLPPTSPYKTYYETSKERLGLALAAAVSYKYPEFSIRIYKEAAEKLIEERNRESYQKACQYLKMIYQLYIDNQQEKKWIDYFRGVVQTYNRLRALKEELHHVGLI